MSIFWLFDEKRLLRFKLRWIGITFVLLEDLFLRFDSEILHFIFNLIIMAVIIFEEQPHFIKTFGRYVNLGKLAGWGCKMTKLLNLFSLISTLSK